jgi:hypothetical protein
MAKVDVVRIEIELADGSLERATGPDAAAIWDHILSLFVLDHVHGGRYDSPKMKPVEREEWEVTTLRADRAALLALWIAYGFGLWWIQGEAIPRYVYPTREAAEAAVLEWAHSRKR